MPLRVPIHVELRVIHSENVKITHTFQHKNVQLRTFFSLKFIETLSLFIHSSESLINFILCLVFNVVLITISVNIHACNSAMPMDDLTAVPHPPIIRHLIRFLVIFTL